MEFIYTWKDVERKLKAYLGENRVSFIVDVDVYPSELVIMTNEFNKEKEITALLIDIFGKKYSDLDKRLYTDKFHAYLDVDIEIDVDAKHRNTFAPLFKNVVYKNNAYEKEIIGGLQLEKCPVIAFHSYKGGVGRTLSLLAFAKAWSHNKPDEKLLIIDSDIEAPGITWLLQNNMINNESFSYLDLLELIQNNQLNNERKVIEDVVELIQGATMPIDTGKIIVEHFVLPTYRYEEQLLDLYSSPESIARGYNNRYILAEILSKIGEAAGASSVLVDLRAGISEFSAPLFFDPRVKKYIVTSTSFQSVQGTKYLLKQICKGLPISEEGIVPEILLTMVPDGLNTTSIKSELVQEYNITENHEAYMDTIITELPFASELIHLSSLDQIMKNLESREFYKNINTFVMNRYVEHNEYEKEIDNREPFVKKIHQFAENQITAEGNNEFAVLLTEPIKNLIKKYRENIPQAIILGAKGAGKTFLFKEMLSKKTWQNFVENFGIKQENTPTTYILPLVTMRNLDDSTIYVIKQTILEFSYNVPLSRNNMSSWFNKNSSIEEFMKNPHDRNEWKQFWISCIADAFHNHFDLETVDEELQKRNQRVLFLVDGLEELFEHTFENEHEKHAIQALIQDVINELKIKYNNIGLLIFLRKDLASNSIKTNFEQFENQYRPIALNWSHDEALRLALWLVSKAIPEFCADINLDNVSQDEVEKKLNRLWGLKLGKNNSNEAYSSRWILAALSDFNSQLQARDIIRFLKNATTLAGNANFKDRYIMPGEIRVAVQKCSKEKIYDIKQEMASLRPILKELENAPEDKKILPFSTDTFNWGANQEKLLKQEGFLIIDNDKYYLPEIIRHALNFRYEKGARPKVLSLILKK